MDDVRDLVPHVPPHLTRRITLRGIKADGGLPVRKLDTDIRGFAFLGGANLKRNIPGGINTEELAGFLDGLQRDLAALASVHHQ
jgi:hypothetical protein